MNIKSKYNLLNCIKIARLNHWIKQLFVIPGIIISIFSTNSTFNMSLIFKCILGIFATSLVASSNYVINEYLDTKYDKYHPTKRNRTIVIQELSVRIIIIEYIVLSIIGLFIASLISKKFLFIELSLLFMGILYNVEPIRTKDIPYLDVLSESFNNLIRFLLGWFIITNEYLPPISIVIGYWMAGAFLMAVKRFAELKMINNTETACLYRKCFKVYTEKSLLVSALFYALISIFLIGIFLIKYHVEFILDIPVLCAIFCYYLYLAYNDDSSVQKPEELYKEKALIFLCMIFVILLVILSFTRIPILESLLDKELIPIKL